MNFSSNFINVKHEMYLWLNSKGISFNLLSSALFIFILDNDDSSVIQRKRRQRSEHGAQPQALEDRQLGQQQEREGKDKIA